MTYLTFWNDVFGVLDDIKDHPYTFTKDSVCSGVTTEEGKEWTIPVPGYGEEDLSVKIEGNRVVVVSKDEKFKYSFYHSMMNLEVDKAEARVEKGILKIRAPFKNKECTCKVLLS